MSALFRWRLTFAQRMLCRNQNLLFARSTSMSALFRWRPAIAQRMLCRSQNLIYAQSAYMRVLICRNIDFHGDGVCNG